MAFAASRIRVGALLFSLTLASCGGSGQRATPAPVPPLGSTAQQPQDAGRGSDGGTSTFFLRQNRYRGELTTSRVSDRDDQLRVAFVEGDETAPCPAVPRVRLTNLTSSPLTLTIRELELDLPCGVGGQQFGLSFFQLVPQPAIVRANKLGDAVARTEDGGGAGRGNDTRTPSSELAFKPVQQITLAPNSTNAFTVLPDPSGAEVALPVAAGSTSLLTSGAQKVPTDLSFFYTSGQGASFYTSSCFDASLLPANVPRVGRPSFFCHINPGSSSLTFGTQVKFFIGTPKVDASVLGLDGPSTTFVCGAASASTECDTPTFTVSNTSATAFQNVIVGNVDALRACVPATEGTDCNLLVSPATATTTVSSRHDFQLLAADDATYRPGAGPWDGLFRTAISGPCHFSTAPDNENGDVPPSPTPGSPGYTDTNQQGIGPYAEFDVTPSGTGTCVITLSEDPKFIVADFSDPVNPKGRSIQLSITIH